MNWLLAVGCSWFRVHRQAELQGLGMHNVPIFYHPNCMFIRLGLLLCLFLIACTASAQQGRVTLDQLFRRYALVPVDSQAMLLREISRHIHDTHSYDSAMVRTRVEAWKAVYGAKAAETSGYAEVMATTAAILHDREGMEHWFGTAISRITQEQDARAAVRIRSAWAYAYMDRFGLPAYALRLYEQNADICQAAHWPEERLDILRNIARHVYTKRGMYDISLSYLLQALAIAREISLTGDALAEIYRDIGLLYYFTADFDRANHMFEEGRRIVQGRTRLRIHLYNNLGLTAQKVRQYEEAARFFDEVIREAIFQKDTAWIGIASGNLGEVYRRLGKDKEAIQLIKKDLELSINTGEVRSALNALYSLVQLSVGQSQYPQAKIYLDSAARLLAKVPKSNTIEAFRHQQGYQQAAALYHASVRQFELAYRAQVEAQRSADSINFTTSAEKLASMQATLDFERQRNDLKIVDKEREIARTTKAQRDYLIIFTVVFFIGTMIAGILFYRQHRHRKLLIHKLHQQHDEIFQKSQALEQTLAHFETLSRIGQRITASLDIQEIIRAVYQEVKVLMDADVFSIGLYNADRQVIEYPLAIEQDKQYPPYTRDMRDRQQLPVWCIEQRQPVWINELEQDYKRYIQYYRSLAIPLEDGTVAPEAVSMLYVPLLYQDRVLGLITVQSFRRSAYQALHLTLLQNLAVQVSIALENAGRYEEIHRQRQLIADKNQHLERQHKDLTSSMSYARRIQNAILPLRGAIAQKLPDHFVLFKPRDIVSGDFYWFADRGPYCILAAVDCTGHGVPGAFMSMVGYSLLSQLAHSPHAHDPGMILREMHHGIRKSLQQVDNDNRDGMDIALCVIDFQQQILSFAGAKNPLVYFQETPEQFELSRKSISQKFEYTLREYKGERVGIGGEDDGREERHYQTHHLPLTDQGKGLVTTIYLFSDGFQDQFGGPRGKKYMAGRFKQLLNYVHREDLNEQRFLLKNELSEWMGSSEQVDDILIMGVRIDEKLLRSARY